MSVECLQATELLALKERPPQKSARQDVISPKHLTYLLKSRLLNLTGTFRRSHSEVLCDAVSVPSGQLPYFIRDRRDTQMVTTECGGEEQFHK